MQIHGPMLKVWELHLRVKPLRLQLPRWQKCTQLPKMETHSCQQQTLKTHHWSHLDQVMHFHTNQPKSQTLQERLLTIHRSKRERTLSLIIWNQLFHQRLWKLKKMKAADTLLSHNKIRLIDYNKEIQLLIVLISIWPLKTFLILQRQPWNSMMNYLMHQLQREIQRPYNLENCVTAEKVVRVRENNPSFNKLRDLPFYNSSIWKH